MKQLILIFLFTLGLTTAAQAKKLWECTVPEIDDGLDAQLIRFEDKVIEMWDDGSVYTYLCNAIKRDNYNVEKDICVERVDDAFYIAIFDEVSKVPSSYTFLEITFGKKIKDTEVYQPDTIKLENCKEY